MFDFRLFLPSASFLKNLVGGLFLPILLPWIIYKLIFSRRYLTLKRAKFENKIVLITGASSGLGEVLAEELYKAGCKLILASRRVEELERVKNKLISLPNDEIFQGNTPAILQIDVADLKGIPAKAADAINIFGKIDYLINNAGISYRGDILHTDLDVDVKLMVVNYFGQIALTKAVLPSMVEHDSGHIISIGSIQGKIALPYRSAYSASKHAMQAFFDSLRSELYDQKINVTVVNPGYIRTNLSLNAMTGDGSTYGQMDKNTATGMDPTVAAKEIMKAIVYEKKEVYLAGWIPMIGVYLRFLCPTVFFAFMRTRAQRLHATIINPTIK